MPGTWSIYNFEALFHKTVNVVSLISAIITLLLVIGLGYFRRHIINRVSLRFQAIIAFVDILRHINYLNLQQPEGRWCLFVAFFGFFVNHIYVFFNVIMALNIQLLYFHDFRPRKSTELFLIFGALNLAFVIDIIPLARDFYGKSSRGSCYIRNEAADEFFFKIILLYIFQLTGLLYILFVFIAVIMLLFLKKDQIEKKFPDKTLILFGEVINVRDFIKKLYFKMALYPVSSFVCYFPIIAAEINFDIHGTNPEWLHFILRFGNRIIGTLNLVALLFDPHFQLAIKNIWRNGLYYSFVDEKESSTDIDLKTVKELKKVDKCLIEFPGQESIEFKDFVKFI